MVTALAWLLATLITAGFAAIAHHDWRTSRVVVRHAIGITAVAVAGFGTLALASSQWTRLAGSILGAVLVTSIQLFPYLMQRQRGGGLIGTADVRLAVPFGWTLGYFGVSFAFIGFAVALVAGLGFALISRRNRIPFVPFMTIGLIVGLGWSALAL
jgi:prepilin signal peptidase PulO-like enzyme (type II secretory pathway)